MRSSIRLSVPSPRFATQTEPKPIATSCGSRPTGTRRPTTRFSRGSMRASVPSPELTTQTSRAADGQRGREAAGPDRLADRPAGDRVDARDRAARAVGDPHAVAAGRHVDGVAADADRPPRGLPAEQRVDRGQRRRRRRRRARPRTRPSSGAARRRATRRSPRPTGAARSSIAVSSPVPALGTHARPWAIAMSVGAPPIRTSATRAAGAAAASPSRMAKHDRRRARRAGA